MPSDQPVARIAVLVSARPDFFLGGMAVLAERAPAALRISLNHLVGTTAHDLMDSLPIRLVALSHDLRQLALANTTSPELSDPFHATPCILCASASITRGACSFTTPPAGDARHLVLTLSVTRIPVAPKTPAASYAPPRARSALSTQ